MEIDWGEALQIGGIGFLLVFAVLAILAVATWLINLLADRIGGGGKGEAAESGGENGGEQANSGAL
jgi:Na+-transporting methylmalonyl-CoA/oxaloacetate decarboxylase gamma subunit